MKKVGIITLNGYKNYGNRLQNYALEEVIRSFGFEVETIINNTNFNKSNSNPTFQEKLNNLKKKSIKELYSLVFNKIENFLYLAELNQKRTQRFKEFSLAHIAETDYSISEENIPGEVVQNYDFFITGSDQVWNPNYRKGSPIEFLTFAPPEKRIAYAASFGISEIPQNYRSNYKLWLSQMPHVSVREEVGAQIVHDLTGRSVDVVLDPTMLLSKSKWLSISKHPSDKPLKQYLLTYFLGDIPRKRLETLKSIAKKNDLEIIHLSQIKDRVPYLSGPSEFIDYINSATLFCTDSFHGAAFSILLETPFVVFNREGSPFQMNSRIDTLLKTFKLESRYAENVKNNNQVFDIDYSHITPIIKQERNKSINYLKRALNIN